MADKRIADFATLEEAQDDDSPACLVRKAKPIT